MLQAVHCNVATKNVTSTHRMTEQEKPWREFGLYLKGAREAAGLSQEGAAKKAGLTRQQWNRLENGLSGTKRETVLMIAEAFNLDESSALNKAGFTPAGVRKKVSSIPELIEALEAVGIVDASFYGGMDKMAEYTEDEFEELKERIMADVGITLRRKRK